MFSFIWHTFFFDPIYNTLIFFVDTITTHDVGLAVIATVVLVKIVLLPIALKASRTNQLMKRVQPELKAIQEKYKDKREELALHLMEVYKREKLNPFSPLLILIIQLPVLFALYFAVRSLPDITSSLLYTFVPTPDVVNMFFLGSIPMDARHMGLALLAGITMHFQARVSLPPKEEKKKDAKPDFAQDMQDSMRTMMLYVLPVTIIVFGYSFAAVISLYFTISNLTSIAQELYVRKKIAA